MGKRATKSVQLVLQHCCKYELNSNVARFSTRIKPVLQQIRLSENLNVGGKTRNVAIQLVLQCCQTRCMLFVARFSVP